MTVKPGGRDAANKLRRLLDLKDEAQYGMIHIGRAELRTTLRQAKSLLNWSSETVEGSGGSR